MSNSSPVNSTGDSKVQLTVATPDEATAITVIDGSFRTVAEGLGYVSVPLDPGIYKVRASAGQVMNEQFVTLPPGTPEVHKQFDPLPFASPVPAPQTAFTHEYHEQAAYQCSREVHATAGSGSFIFIMARDFTAPNTRRSSPTLAPNPALGLALLDAQGHALVDFGEGALKGPQIFPWWQPSFDPVAACNVAVNPGIYYLRLTLASRETIHQTIVAAPNWQTQIFALQRSYGPTGDDRRADLASAGILMARPGHGFIPADGVRLAELARLGLAGGRTVLHGDVIEAVYTKTENPMLGIQGAHLLLLESEPDLAMLNRVVGNLRGMLGPHPDVEALALKLSGDSSGYIFADPPMLRRSWNLVVEASIRRPELVPPGSTGARMASQVWGDRPWLLWRSPAPATPDNLGSFEPGSAAAPDNPAQQASYVSAMQSYIRPPAVSKDLFTGPGGQPADAPLNEEEIESLVRQLGLPRANVEDLYRTAQAQPPTKRPRKSAR